MVVVHGGARLGVVRDQAHAEGVEEAPLGHLVAEGLAVHEVAPTADGLGQHDTGAYGIHDLQGVDLLVHRRQHQRGTARNDAAVDGKASLPDGDHVDEILVLMGIQGRHHVVEAGPQDTEEDGEDAHIQHIVGGKALSLGADDGVDKGGHDTQHDDDAIPVDGLTEKLKGHAIDRKLADAQAGEGYCGTHRNSFPIPKGSLGGFRGENHRQGILTVAEGLAEKLLRVV